MAEKLQRIAHGLASTMTTPNGVFVDPALAALSIEEAKQIQALALADVPWPIGAWKAGASNYASRASLGLQACFIGPIPQARVLESPATINTRQVRTHLIECEIALRLDIKGWLNATSDDVRPYLISVHPALELPDTRYAAIGENGTAALIADFGAAGGALIGKGVTYQSDDSIWEGLTCELMINEAIVAYGNIEALVADPVTVAACLRPEFERFAINGFWGEYILLGGMTPAVAIKSGDSVCAQFDRFGALDLSVE